MPKRFVTIWFRHLHTDWFCRRQPELKDKPFILAQPDHGRMVVCAANSLAETRSVYPGMVVADARAIIPDLLVLDDKPGLSQRLLNGIAEWCIRFSPAVAVDEPGGLILDASGCAHLWGGEREYLTDIYKRLKEFGYDIRIAMADTIGAAWAMARCGQGSVLVEPGLQTATLMPLPVSALRIESAVVERLEKLGLRQISDIIPIPRPSLRRRFGPQILLRLQQALGLEAEWIIPIQPLEPYQERLPCLEPIVTATGIEIALDRLLDALCLRLQQEQKGLRFACFKAYRVDGKIEQIQVGTNRPSCQSKHLLKLFQLKIETIEPAMGIELFTLDALKVEDLTSIHGSLWEDAGGLENNELSELLDRIAGKVGANSIHRYVPAEHYWPERSCKLAGSLDEQIGSAWRVDRPRPLQLLFSPQPIEVTAPVPDYPPMLFRYKGKLHKILKADGPERIEQEWWLQEGQHRDYYSVEDEEGKRYWLFRLGHYDAEKTHKWYIHGFFA